MKTLIAVVVVTMLGLVSCSNENKSPAPIVSQDKGGPQESAPDLTGSGPTERFGSIELDGTWTTKCMNKSVQTKYTPYISEMNFLGNKFYQKVTSFSDDECKVISGKPTFTIGFNFSVGSEVKSGVKAFDITWNVTLKDKTDGKDHHYQGKSFNIMNVTGNVMKFFPLYEVATDEFDGTTEAKRFQSFLNPTINHEEEYTREE